MKQAKNKQSRILLLGLVLLGSIFLSLSKTTQVQAVASGRSVSQADRVVFAEITPQEFKIDKDDVKTNSVCGAQPNDVKVVIDIGCRGQGNAILDAAFAILRFLTLGASLVIIGSTIVAGIQFTTSRGDPQATAAAIKRITNNAAALLLFIFTYAILNWLVPNTILR